MRAVDKDEALEVLEVYWRNVEKIMGKDSEMAIAISICHKLIKELPEKDVL